MTTSRRTLAILATGSLAAAGLAASAAVAPAALAAPAPGGPASALQGRVSIAHPDFRPASASPDQRVRVIITLSGTTVADRAASAAAAGRTVTRTTRARDRVLVRAAQNAAVRALRSAGAVIDRRYTDAINGVSATVAVSALPALARVPGVLSVERVATYKPDNGRSNAYTGAADAWAGYGATGAGVKVAIIDTGVDYGHADFGGPGTVDYFTSNDSTVIEDSHPFPTSKVVGGYDFAGDNYDASDTTKNVPSPDPDPLDCAETAGGGHGTHVAGTAAGFGVTQEHGTYTGTYSTADVTAADLLVNPGSAPQAKILAYRVFGCSGSTDDTVVTAAIDRALADGAKVINMSLGSPYGTTSGAYRKVIANAVRHGITVVVSAGNSGPSPYLVSSPSTVPAALSVAAADVIPSFPGATLAKDSTSIHTIVANGVSPLPASLPLYVIPDNSGGIGLGCDSADYPPADVAGKLVVAKRGTCARTERAVLAQAAGAAGALMVNSVDGPPPFEGDIEGVTIPFLGALASDGAALLALDGQTVTLTGDEYINPGYKALTSFTSGGPRSGDAGVKPEISAPGASLISAKSGSGYESLTLSGTSMASPHTAGIAALVREAHPDWTAQEVKDSLANTASHDPSILRTSVTLGGNGMVQALPALTTKVLLQANAAGDTGLTFGVREGSSLNARKVVTVINTTTEPITIHLSADSDAGLDLGVWPRVLTVPPGRSAVTVRATIAADVVSHIETNPNANPLPVFTGHIRATVPDASPVSMPVLVVQHGRSAIHSLLTRRPLDGPRQYTVRMRNTGNHTGTAEVFEWLVRDDRYTQAAFDVRALGAESFPAGESDRVIVMAVSSYNRFSNAASTEVDIPIDTTGDGTADFVVFSADYGWVTTGSPDGRLGSFQYNLGTDALTGSLAYAPNDGSLIELPMLASDLGITSGNPLLKVLEMESYPLSDVGEIDYLKGLTATFNAFDPQRTTGGYAELAASTHDTVDVSSRTPGTGEKRSLGWMVAQIENRSGTAQTSLLPAR